MRCKDLFRRGWLESVNLGMNGYFHTMVTCPNLDDVLSTNGECVRIITCIDAQVMTQSGVSIIAKPLMYTISSTGFHFSLVSKPNHTGNSDDHNCLILLSVIFTTA